MPKPRTRLFKKAGTTTFEFVTSTNPAKANKINPAKLKKKVIVIKKNVK